MTPIKTAVRAALTKATGMMDHLIMILIPIALTATGSATIYDGIRNTYLPETG